MVPREKKFDEHVNDPQVKFCREVENRMGTIVVFERIEELGNVLENHDGMKTEEKIQVTMLSSVRI